MDEIDIKILEVLQSRGRISISDLAIEVSLSRPSVNERVQRLQEKNIIERFTAVVSPVSVGRKLLVMIELNDLRVPMEDFELYIKNNEPEVIECYQATGHVHYYIKAALNDIDDLTRLITNLTPYGDTRTAILLDAIVDNKVILPVTGSNDNE